MSELDDLKKQLEELKRKIEEMEQQEKDIIYFEHTHVYYRPERNAYIARWNSKPYNLKHIKQCASKEEAIAIAREYDEIARFVLSFLDL